MQNKTTILHIASGDLWAGAEVQLFTLCKTLSQADDLEVIVILLNHGTLESRLAENNIKTLIFDESRLGGITIFFKILQCIRSYRPAVIHTHRFKENILGGIAGFLTSTPCIRTEHGASEHTHKRYRVDKTLINWLDRFVGRYLQRHVIAVSHDLAHKLKQRYGKNIVTIQNGIDLELLDKSTTHHRQANDKPIFNIGIVGRLTDVKRVDIFLQAAKNAVQNYHDRQLVFHVYGDGPLRHELDILCQQLGLATHVLFHGHTEAIHQKISELDVLLITSDHEGLPMTLLEALYLETPIISHSVGGIPDVCMGETYCWLCENNDATTISSRLLECLNNYPDAILKAKAAKKHIEQHYSATSNAANIRELYQKTILE